MGSVVHGHESSAPKRSDLKYVVRSVGVTLSNSGVRPSYILACTSACGLIGHDPRTARTG